MRDKQLNILIYLFSGFQLIQTESSLSGRASGHHHVNLDSKGRRNWSDAQFNVWKDLQCPNIKNYHLPLKECKEKCETTASCTAINYGIMNSNIFCALRDCPFPIPSPDWALNEFWGYHITDQLESPSGNQQAALQISHHDHDSVTFPVQDSDLANTTLPPKDNIVVNGGWTNFAKCSATCGGGIQERQCLNPMPANGGKTCMGESHQYCDTGIACSVSAICSHTGEAKERCMCGRVEPKAMCNIGEICYATGGINNGGTCTDATYCFQYERSIISTEKNITLIQHLQNITAANIGNMTNAEECQKMCKKIPGCTFFTWIEQDPKHDSEAVCYFKEGRKDISAMANAVSGPSICGSGINDCLDQETLYDGTEKNTSLVEDLIKKSYHGNHDVNSLESCQDFCRDTAGCSAFSWIHHEKHCQLHEDIKRKYNFPGATSGQDYCSAECNEIDVTYTGVNIPNGLFNNVSSWKVCGIICQTIDNCHAWTWHLGHKECHLKSWRERRRQKGGYIAGVKSCPELDCPENHTSYHGNITKGAALNNIFSEMACADECRKVKECEFWTWDENVYKCYLIENLDGRNDEADGMISGKATCLKDTGLTIDTSTCIHPGMSYGSTPNHFLAEASQIVLSYEDCQSLCVRTTGCYVFSYRDHTKRCELKADIKTSYADPSVISGPAVCGPGCEEKHTSYVGHTISNWTFDGIQIWEECGVRCQKFGTNCKFWTWDGISKICNLTKSDQGRMKIDQHVSGSHACPTFEKVPEFDWKNDTTIQVAYPNGKTDTIYLSPTDTFVIEDSDTDDKFSRESKCQFEGMFEKERTGRIFVQGCKNDSYIEIELISTGNLVTEYKKPQKFEIRNGIVRLKDFSVDFAAVNAVYEELPPEQWFDLSETKKDFSAFFSEHNSLEDPINVHRQVKAVSYKIAAGYDKTLLKFFDRDEKRVKKYIKEVIRKSKVFFRLSSLQPNIYLRLYEIINYYEIEVEPVRGSLEDLVYYELQKGGYPLLIFCYQNNTCNSTKTQAITYRGAGCNSDGYSMAIISRYQVECNQYDITVDVMNIVHSIAYLLNMRNDYEDEEGNINYNLACNGKRLLSSGQKNIGWSNCSEDAWQQFRHFYYINTEKGNLESLKFHQDCISGLVECTIAGKGSMCLCGDMRECKKEICQAEPYGRCPIGINKFNIKTMVSDNVTVGDVEAESSCCKRCYEDKYFVGMFYYYDIKEHKCTCHNQGSETTEFLSPLNYKLGACSELVEKLKVEDRKCFHYGANYEDENVDLYLIKYLEKHSTLANNERTCFMRCQNINGCTKWTYIIRDKMCHLKSGLKRKFKDEHAISGPSICGAGCQDEDTTYLGPDMERSTYRYNITSWSKCGDVCHVDHSCNSWSWDKATRKCFTKSTGLLKNITSWVKCGYACQNTTDCENWTWDKAKSECHIKSFDIDIHHISGLISGSVTCPQMDHLPVFKFQGNKNVSVEYPNNNSDVAQLTKASSITGGQNPCIFEGIFKNETSGIMIVIGCFGDHIIEVLVQSAHIPKQQLFELRDDIIKDNTEEANVHATNTGIEELPLSEKLNITKVQISDTNQEDIKMDVKGVKLSIDIGYDKTLLQKLGSKEKVTQWIEKIVSIGKTFLKLPSLEPNIELVVKNVTQYDITLHPTPRDLAHVMEYQMGHHRPIIFFCSIEASCDSKVEQGIAYRGGFCKNNGYGVAITSHFDVDCERYRLAIDAKGFAKQVGILLNMHFDFLDLDTGGINEDNLCNGQGLMSLGHTPIDWSPCSQRSWQNYHDFYRMKEKNKALNPVHFIPNCFDDLANCNEVGGDNTLCRCQDNKECELIVCNSHPSNTCQMECRVKGDDGQYYHQVMDHYQEGNYHRRWFPMPSMRECMLKCTDHHQKCVAVSYIERLYDNCAMHDKMEMLYMKEMEGATFVPQKCIGCEEEEIMYIGEELDTGKLSVVKSWEECGTMCKVYSDCLNWSWNRRENECWMKKNLNSRVYNMTDYVSGPEWCPRIEWDNWTRWGPCSVSCGTGFHRKTRECKKATGFEYLRGKCSGAKSKVKACTVGDCKESEARRNVSTNLANPIT